MAAFLQVIGVLTQVTYEFMIDRITMCHNQIPYHTFVLSGEGWVQELITGHPQCMQTELGIHWSTFIVLIKAIQDVSLWSLHHVSIEQQVSIFLYTMVTGLPCTHVGEHFQWSSGMVTK